jgi:hypothetical protein
MRPIRPISRETLPAISAIPNILTTLYVRINRVA